VLGFIRPHKNVIDYELLPYHRFGESKYGFLGKFYGLADFVQPSPDSLAPGRRKDFSQPTPPSRIPFTSSAISLQQERTGPSERRR